MFQHLDANSDSKLSLQELYDLEHDQSEVCLKPFLQQCDIDRDVIVTPSEWCRCFQRTERPCAAVKRKITPELLGTFDMSAQRST
jgi:sparc/osteonectin/cwcv/kazal-like domain-containing proteoglycan (testican)